MAKEYTAIRVGEDVKKEAAEAKRDGETWDEYVLRCAENPPEVREFVETESLYEVGNPTPVDDRGTFGAADVLEASEADIDDAKREILGRIDDLESQLPRRIKEELKP